MKTAIVYSSRTGNTELLAKTIRAALPEECCVYFGFPDDAALLARRIYVGFWTDRGCCCSETAAFLRSVTDQEIFLFGTAGFGGDQAYFDQVLRRTEKHLPKGARIIGRFMCQGKMPSSVRSRYEKMLQGPIKPPHLQEMIENFDRASTHPDADDLARLTDAVSALH